MPKHLIFDFDGTLADSFGVVISLFHEMTGDKHKLDAAAIESLRGLPAGQVLKRLGIPLWRGPFMLARGRKLMHGRVGELQAFPGLPEVLAALHERGHVMYILSSNSAENINVFLRQQGMAAYFSAIYGNVGLFSKARTMRKVIRTNRIEKADCIYIGDEARDVHAAVRVGMACIAVSWGYNTPLALRTAGADEVAATPQDLLRLLEDA